jgi:hypothetical protein
MRNIKKFKPTFDKLEQIASPAPLVAVVIAFDTLPPGDYHGAPIILEPLPPTPITILA